MAWTVGEVRTYSYTGAAQNETLDPGIYKLECWGGEGKSGYYTPPPIRGKGGYVKGDIIISEPTPLEIYIGGGGGQSRLGGWNGGGTSGTVTVYGGGGGGGTDIRIGGSALENRVIVAGGGGGTGAPSGGNSGDGGGLVGLDGGGDSMYSGKGGTQTAGGDGSPPGALGVAGLAGPRRGGGGGGYYAGGCGFDFYTSGGGGSSYYGDLLNPETTAGQRVGNGEVKITMLSALSKSRRMCQII